MRTLLDNDLYKFTMMQAVRAQYPEAEAGYRFINRSPETTFSKACVEHLRALVADYATALLTENELEYLATLPFIRADFVAFLKGFQLQAGDIHIALDEGQLAITLSGTWVNTILWEVPLMAMISQAYFATDATEWPHELAPYVAKTAAKGQRLTENGCNFIEFGTRRRRSYPVQDAVLTGLTQSGVQCGGTSNLHFAMKYGLEPIGTMAHEWIMGHAGLFDVASANRRGLQAWIDFYDGRLDTALTDTYTTELFLENIQGNLAIRYDALRHDSECPFAFTDQVLAFYQREGIDALQKGIVYSDSLNVDKAIEIERYAAGRIQTYYGIGTHLTNDFAGSPALNMVIKLHTINGIEVAKISDSPTKACGSQAAIKNALKIINAR